MRSVCRSISAPTCLTTAVSSSTALVSGDLEALVGLGPELVEARADAEDRRHPVLLGEQLEEVDQLLARPPRSRVEIPSRFSAEEK